MMPCSSAARRNASSLSPREDKAIGDDDGGRNDDGAALYAEANSLGNVRIDVWADSPETDGYVYRKVLGAVQAWKPGN